ncbi:MAG: isoprenylcysteine carboxylmethyltransferase family protein [Ruminococcaceae bacterium]|nr:isoprenylcysteine carboxylmethyltransferase family protein [Oscillospiraceae bacterium]
MTRSLFLQAIGKFFLGVLLVGVLLFLPAGTLHYPGGWLLMGVLFLPMFGAGLLMMRKNPALLRSRLQARESRREQNLVVKLSGLMFLLGFITAGLDFRFGWSALPRGVVIAAVVAFFAAYGLYAEVLRENTWLSRTIEVQENQQVIDTGLYGIVRHPMYSATLLLFLSMPLILGSFYAFLLFLCYPVLIVCRIRDEERLLQEELPGYTAYQKKVKYRLLPFIW